MNPETKLRNRLAGLSLRMLHQAHDYALDEIEKTREHAMIVLAGCSTDELERRGVTLCDGCGGYGRHLSNCTER